MDVLNLSWPPVKFNHNVICQRCQNLTIFTLEWNAYKAWKYEGKLIQDAFPNLSSDERELLISGICGECFDNIFKHTNEEEVGLI